MQDSTTHRIQLLQGDITKVKVDAIVNAANSSLLGGGGVDGAIHRAGGPAILEDCRKIVARQGGCKTGEAVITTGGRLPAKYVIHTVGPVWNGGHKNEPTLLANCYRNSLELAREHRLETIAFPNISTGIYGYPKDKAAEVAVQTVQTYLGQHDLPKQVMFVVFDPDNLRLYEEQLAHLKS
ncbi:O-acetyl-ADP-ribose deacetylase [Rufibacter roseolus]|uniref:O-acetyl-ADP-ribose deacetylase n=1 Tax=Rufibacter roseolus TaxID=2817375 RepID=UPI001B307EA0|nr:O-acetyl-ADP-ribose deacetylase [Rufibacter roseolus]